MLVDDSIVARSVLQSILDPLPEFAIVATASSAEQALVRVAAQPVDVVLLDLGLPGIDGLSALPAILERGRGARVLVVSASAAVGADACVRALTLGAADTLEKPTAGFGAAFRSDLIGKLRRIAREPAAADRPCHEPAIVPCAPIEGPIACIAIGASTGGPHALPAFFASLPGHIDAPILVTQHLPPAFMPFFADQLSAMAGRPARVAGDDDVVERGDILIAPGEGHLTVERDQWRVRVRIGTGRTSSGCLPSADPMFASVADVYGAAAYGVVLSGMGRDGVVGARRIVEAGGEIAAQDRASSVVWGMPGAVVNQGLAAIAAEPAAIAMRIGRRAVVRA